MRIFQTPLVNFINMDHELVHLAQHIDWNEVENDLGRKLNSQKRKRQLGDFLLYSRFVTQTFTHKIKVYSLTFDGHTLPEQLEQIKRLSRMTIENVLVNREYRGRKWIGDTKVEIPGSSKATDSYYKRQIDKKTFRRGAGIEPVIGHLKQDHRMQLNFLKGNVGDSINTMMAAAGYNLKHWLFRVSLVFNLIYRILIAEVLNLFTENRKRLALQFVGGNFEKKGFWQN